MDNEVYRASDERAVGGGSNGRRYDGDQMLRPRCTRVAGQGEDDFQVCGKFLMSFYRRSLPTYLTALPSLMYSPGRSSVRNIRFSVRCTVTDRATHKKCGFCQPPETAMSPSNADVWPWRLLGVCWLNLEQVCFCTRQCGSARHLPSLQRVPCHA